MSTIIAAHVWTWWLSIPLFVAAVVLDLTIAVLYLRRFVLPKLVHQQVQDRVEQHMAEVHQLPARPADEADRAAQSGAATQSGAA
jgi:membrane protein implicated in regulation of membrane protease activity